MLSDWLKDYEGYAVRDYMIANCDYVGYLIAAYLALVFVVPPFLANLKKNNIEVISESTLRNSMIAWNLLLSGFSCIGSSFVTPAIIQSLYSNGFHSTMCDKRDEFAYTGPVGFFIGIFVLSKIPELVDTVWLVLGQKNVIFLHWYHHVTVLLYCWHTYSVGISTMICFAAMNYGVHSIMYFYFAVCAMGYKSIARRFASLITLLQILQMVVGTAVTAYSAYEFHFGTRGCHVTKANARMGLLMYSSYLVLFSQLFIKSYISPARGASPRSSTVTSKPGKA